MDHKDRKAYEAPSLEVLGSLSGITENGASPNFDDKDLTTAAYPGS
nr:hypothetical protein [uncultured Halomonas sp.]